MSIKLTKDLIKLGCELEDDGRLSRKGIEQLFNVSPRTAHRYIGLLRKHFNAPIVYDDRKNVYHYSVPWSIEEELKK